MGLRGLMEENGLSTLSVDLGSKRAVLVMLILVVGGGVALLRFCYKSEQEVVIAARIHHSSLIYTRQTCCVFAMEIRKKRVSLTRYPRIDMM